MSTVACIRDIITGGEVTGIATARCIPAFPIPLANMRLPTDPLYYMTLTLENIVVGSRYRITRQSTGDELATGIASNTTEVISGVPVYSSSMLMAITVRKASGSPNYKIFDTNVYAARLGASAYILQQLDE